MNTNDLYTEDVIVELKDKLESLKGNIIMDEYDDLFIFQDYSIKSLTYNKGIFFKKEVTEFYIEWIKINSGTEIIVRDDGMFCSWYGITELSLYHEKWCRLQNKLIRFSIDTNTPLNFTSMNLTK